MLDQNIKTARKFISDELSSVYPREELISLTRIILLETTEMSNTDILAHPEEAISGTSWHKINKICAELKENRPIQHILGKTEFYGISLIVDENTLIPRQETEELVDLIIKENKSKVLSLLDIGTGSGAIAVALSLKLGESKIMASDISEEALKIARKNAAQHNCDISFFRDDILSSSLIEKENLDIVVSNPPYVRQSEKISMHPNVINYEPHSALFVPDEDPLIFYRAIGQIALQILKKGGLLYLEINEALGKETASLLAGMNFQNTSIINDLNNKNRIIKAVKPL